MNLEQINDCYFNYLTDEIFNSLFKAKKYECKDFEILKLELLLNLRELLKSRKDFNDNIKILSLFRKNDIK